MDCGICLEKVDKKNIQHLRCSHFLCKDCLDRLTKPICPYCRTEFSSEKNVNCNNNVNNYFYETDNILPNSYLQDLHTNNHTYDVIHYNRRQVKSKYIVREKTDHATSFVSNRDRVFPERKKKKWKKRRNVIEV